MWFFYSGIGALVSSSAILVFCILAGWQTRYFDKLFIILLMTAFLSSIISTYWLYRALSNKIKRNAVRFAFSIIQETQNEFIKDPSTTPISGFVTTQDAVNVCQHILDYLKNNWEFLEEKPAFRKQKRGWF